jgi:5-methylcytosine-specific restriction endonuclease McrA
MDELRVTRTNTDGWKCELARMGRGRPWLELWLDRYPLAKQRRFWYGFYSPDRSKIRQVIRRVPEHLEPGRELSLDHVKQVGRHTWLLAVPLRRGDFGQPIFEHYHGRYFYFGMFDPAVGSDDRHIRLLVRRAAAFLEEVARSLPNTQPASDEDLVYADHENRRAVRQHIARERSAALAEARKIQDGYRCQVCRMTFEQVYGEIGREFAEAHHVVPLSRLRGQVRTTLHDLITVCANCHRMLHRMEGKRGDVAVLHGLVRQHQR